MRLRLTSVRLGTAVLVAGCALCAAPCRAAASAPESTSIFAGKVLAVDSANHRFTMQAGSSKKIAQVHVQVRPGTRWSGLPRKGMPAAGDTVVVNAKSQAADMFVASTVRVQDPAERPSATRPREFRL